MSEKLARLLLGVVAGLALVLTAAVDLPEAADGRFWSDGATYHAMAGSLAFDGDLAFAPEDLARVRRVHPAGPQGVFLKRVRGGSGASRLVYAKPFLYPALGAPFARVLGVDRGLLVLNGALFALALGLGYSELRRGGTSVAAVAGVLSLFALGAAPLYLLWETPEVLNLALVTAGLVAFRRDRPLLAAVALGLSVYSKPTQLAAALPLLLAPFVSGERGLARRGLEAGRRSAVLAAAAAACFALGWLATGEINYQGGERKTFYDSYPYDPGVSFDSAGVWMTTNQVGPLVAGRDDDLGTDRVAPPRAPAELGRSFLLNLGYFWIGRFGGALPYFPGFAAALALFLALGPRSRDGWLALLAIGVAWIGTILVIPDNWYGGAGTIGNRYLLGFLPLGLLLLPRTRALVAAAFAAVVAGALLLPVLASPIRHSLEPGAHATRPAFRLLPAELTMLSDLSVFTEVWRKRRPYDPPQSAPYFLWFLDDGTFGQESSFGREGFWLRGGERAEVVLQAARPPARLRLAVTAGPGGDIVTLRLGGVREQLVLQPLKSREVTIESPQPLLGYYGTSLYRLQLGSRFGGSTDADGRRLGSFVVVRLE